MYISLNIKRKVIGNYAISMLSLEIGYKLLCVVNFRLSYKVTRRGFQPGTFDLSRQYTTK